MGRFYIHPHQVQTATKGAVPVGSPTPSRCHTAITKTALCRDVDHGASSGSRVGRVYLTGEVLVTSPQDCGLLYYAAVINQTRSGADIRGARRLNQILRTAFDWLPSALLISLHFVSDRRAARREGRWRVGIITTSPNGTPVVNRALSACRHCLPVAVCWSRRDSGKTRGALRCSRRAPHFYSY